MMSYLRVPLSKMTGSPSSTSYVVLVISCSLVFSLCAHTSLEVPYRIKWNRSSMTSLWTTRVTLTCKGLLVQCGPEVSGILTRISQGGDILGRLWWMGFGKMAWMLHIYKFVGESLLGLLKGKVVFSVGVTGFAFKRKVGGRRQMKSPK